MIDEEQEDFLLNKFCEDEYEVIEMKKWISKKGIQFVFEKIKELFYEEDDI